MLPIPLFETFVSTHRPPLSKVCLEFHRFGIIYEHRHIEIPKIVPTNLGELVQEITLTFSGDSGYVPTLSPITVSLDPSVDLSIALGKADIR